MFCWYTENYREDLRVSLTDTSWLLMDRLAVVRDWTCDLTHARKAPLDLQIILQSHFMPGLPQALNIHFYGFLTMLWKKIYHLSTFKSYLSKEYGFCIGLKLRYRTGTIKNVRYPTLKPGIHCIIWACFWPNILVRPKFSFIMRSNHGPTNCFRSAVGRSDKSQSAAVRLSRSVPFFLLPLRLHERG